MANHCESQGAIFHDIEHQLQENIFHHFSHYYFFKAVNEF